MPSPPITFLKRRSLAGLVLLPWLGGLAHADPAVAARLRTGGCAVLLRHSQTDAGIGDPPGFELGSCRTQRNLSEAGRAQAGRIGAWFRAQGLKPAAVRSSAWCRCIDTAELAFGRHEVWAPLNSTFDDRTTAPAATAALRTALAAIPAGRFEVWVTHQVNITALTGEFASMGEAAVVDTRAKVQARTRFGAD
ncbi:MAG: histidine phosphatase family protein [Comamonadaceae bacterium]|nr:MAG: histidine phosphatase family protein [Comamonadaceae bacterium]